MNPPPPLQKSAPPAQPPGLQDPNSAKSSKIPSSSPEKQPTPTSEKPSKTDTSTSTRIPNSFSEEKPHEPAITAQHTKPHENTQLRSTPTNRLPILSGLLASGHYSTTVTPSTPSTDEDGGVIRHDAGKDWRADQLPQRFSSAAVEDAIMLANELIEACSREVD